jgi:hypothetical protein
LIIALLQKLAMRSYQFRRALLERDKVLSFQKKMLHCLLTPFAWVMWTEKQCLRGRREYQVGRAYTTFGNWHVGRPVALGYGETGA